MTMHTPRPWYCDPSDTKHDFPARQPVFGGGFLLAEVAGNGKGSSGANARLIAAAPELYDVLARLAAECLRPEGPTDMTVREALTILQKTEGR